MPIGSNLPQPNPLRLSQPQPQVPAQSLPPGTAPAQTPIQRPRGGGHERSIPLSHGRLTPEQSGGFVNYKPAGGAPDPKSAKEMTEKNQAQSTRPPTPPPYVSSEGVRNLGYRIMSDVEQTSSNIFDAQVRNNQRKIVDTPQGRTTVPFGSVHGNPPHVSAQTHELVDPHSDQPRFNELPQPRLRPGGTEQDNAFWRNDPTRRVGPNNPLEMEFPRAKNDGHVDQAIPLGSLGSETEIHSHPSVPGYKSWQASRADIQNGEQFDQKVRDERLTNPDLPMASHMIHTPAPRRTDGSGQTGPNHKVIYGTDDNGNGVEWIGRPKPIPGMATPPPPPTDRWSHPHPLDRTYPSAPLGPLGAEHGNPDQKIYPAGPDYRGLEF